MAREILARRQICDIDTARERFCEDKGHYEVSAWMQLGHWGKPNLFEMSKASHRAALKTLFENWEQDFRELFPGVVENALWKLKSFGPATIMETPGHVGSNLIDIEAEGIEGLYLIGERTKEAKVMGVYGSAQVALAAFDMIMGKYPQAAAMTWHLLGADHAVLVIPEFSCPGSSFSYSSLDLFQVSTLCSGPPPKNLLMQNCRIVLARKFPGSLSQNEQ